MITTLKPRPTPLAPQDLDRLIVRLGARRVLVAALLVALRGPRRAAPPPVDGLDPHLRRDLGLSPIERPPTPRMPVW